MEESQNILMIYRAITTNAINDYNKNPAVLFLEYL
jgi:hypothetical protein